MMQDPMIGKVTISGGAPTVQGEQEFQEVPLYFPYGFQANIPIGERALVIRTPIGPTAVGTYSRSDDLEPGEIRIMSAGGAQIVLKNDGRVLINNQAF